MMDDEIPGPERLHVAKMFNPCLVYYGRMAQYLGPCAKFYYVDEFDSYFASSLEPAILRKVKDGAQANNYFNITNENILENGIFFSRTVDDPQVCEFNGTNISIMEITSS